MADAKCGTEGTEIAPGICEVSFTTAGDFTFTAPSGVSKLAAVIAGAGGGSLYSIVQGAAYGGGGGEVVYTERLSTTDALAITVGAGGQAYNGDAGQVQAYDGESSSVGSVEARGGHGGGWQSIGGAPLDIGGTSGNDNFGSLNDNALFNTGAGGGAGAAAPDCYTGTNLSSCPGGQGVTASFAANNSSLFPALLGEPEYGMGGDGIPGLNTTSVGEYAAGHGGNALSASAGDDGNDGAVILRWALPSLPNTGVDSQPWIMGVASAAVIFGAVLVSGLFRSRRTGRHSA